VRCLCAARGRQYLRCRRHGDRVRDSDLSTRTVYGYDPSIFKHRSCFVAGRCAACTTRIFGACFVTYCYAAYTTFIFERRLRRARAASFSATCQRSHFHERQQTPANC
jgi:hypothetical protein